MMSYPLRAGTIIINIVDDEVGLQHQNQPPMHGLRKPPEIRTGTTTYIVLAVLTSNTDTDSFW